MDACVPLKAVLILYFCHGSFPTGYRDEVGVLIPLFLFYSFFSLAGQEEGGENSVETTVWRLFSFTSSMLYMGN